MGPGYMELTHMENYLKQHLTLLPTFETHRVTLLIISKVSVDLRIAGLMALILVTNVVRGERGAS